MRRIAREPVPYRQGNCPWTSSHSNFAEIACRQADVARCNEHIQQASAWILRSGSVEHLCSLHLVRVRAARAEGNSSLFQRELDEGLHLAQQCGLGLYHIELLCEQSEQALRSGNAESARKIAVEALHRAHAAVMQRRRPSQPRFGPARHENNPGPEEHRKIVMNFWSASTWLSSHTRKFAPDKSPYAVGFMYAASIIANA